MTEREATTLLVGMFTREEWEHLSLQSEFRSKLESATPQCIDQLGVFGLHLLRDRARLKQRCQISDFRPHRLSAP